MKINRKLNNKGFTIVETLIVLAIAAVILIIVLLAVPALQRSSKNATSKNDATTIAGAVSDFESTNGGSYPGSWGYSGTPGLFYICAAGNPYCSSSTNSTTMSVSQSENIIGYGGSPTTAITWYTDYSQAKFVTGTPTEPSGDGACGYTLAQACQLQLAPQYLAIVFAATCNSTSSAVGTTSYGAATTAAASSEIAILYPVESGSSSGSVWCVQG